ncbi:HTH_Tnp_Tc3_2 domain-containing protein [Trichonephila clavipes]|nr:HTH_Tnp_Tc3_2 domain-containing protein [Trichonephila clavipes]
MDPRGVIYTKTRLRKPSTDQPSRRPLHRDPVSSPIIRRRLAEGHLRSWHPLRGLPLTLTHRRLRVWSGAMHEETGLQRNGTRSSLVTNPDSISAVMTIVFVFVSNRAYLESFGMPSWASHEFDRTRGKGTANMERNVSRHQTELVCRNVRSYHIVHSR